MDHRYGNSNCISFCNQEKHMSIFKSFDETYHQSRCPNGNHKTPRENLASMMMDCMDVREDILEDFEEVQTVFNHGCSRSSPQRNNG